MAIAEDDLQKQIQRAGLVEDFVEACIQSLHLEDDDGYATSFHSSCIEFYTVESPQDVILMLLSIPVAEKLKIAENLLRQKKSK